MGCSPGPARWPALRPDGASTLDAALRTSPIDAAVNEDAEIRLLIAALDAEGSDQRGQGIPAGLVDRVFDASVIELRSGVARGLDRDLASIGVDSPASVGSRPSLRLVGASAVGSPARDVSSRGVMGRDLSWRRLAPLAAMAACIALAPLVAVPVMGPALALDRTDNVVPVALMDSGTSVEPVLAALLQHDGDGAWRGVPMTAIDVSMLQPSSGPAGEAASAGAATLIPLVEAHQSEFADFAAEFARIRQAANRASDRS